MVITFMLGGTALCVIALVLAWRALGKKLRQIARDYGRAGSKEQDPAYLPADA